MSRGIRRAYPSASRFVLASSLVVAGCSSAPQDSPADTSSQAATAADKTYADSDACTGTPLSVAQAAALVPNNSSLDLGTTLLYVSYDRTTYVATREVATLEHFGTWIALSMYAIDDHGVRRDTPRISYPLPVDTEQSSLGYVNSYKRVLLTASCYRAFESISGAGDWGNHGELLSFDLQVPQNPPCTPTTCDAEKKNCGSIPDGCGGTLSCGTCANGATCTSLNICEAPFCCGPYTYPARNSSGTWSCWYSDFWPDGGCTKP